MAQHVQYVVWKLFDMKLQLHEIEVEPALSLPADVIEHTIALLLDLYSRGYTCVSFAVALGDRH